MAKAKAMAITWENWTTSIAPWIGEVKSFVNKTSMQVVNIITSIPKPPIHSSQPLNRRLNFSNLLSMVTNLGPSPPSLSPDWEEGKDGGWESNYLRMDSGLISLGPVGEDMRHSICFLVQ